MVNDTSGQGRGSTAVWLDFAAYHRWLIAHRAGAHSDAAFLAWCGLGKPGSGPPPEPVAAPAPAPESQPSDVVPWDEAPEEPEALPEVPTTPAPRAADLLIAYTDGSGNIATRPCGAGVVVLDASAEAVEALGQLPGAVVIDGAVVVLEASVHLGLGTNNHAEVCAAGLALRATDTPAWRARPLEVRTDSTYVQWALGRPAPLPPTRDNAAIINAALRLRMERVAPRRRPDAPPGGEEPGDVPLPPRRLSTRLVKGHTGEPGNDRADALAGIARLRPQARTAVGEAVAS